MNLRPHRQDNPEINLAPLIDVVFLLLIFFMLSTTFREDARLQIALPEAEGEALPAEEPSLVTITIDREGGFYVADRQVVDQTAATLRRALDGALGEARDRPVLIKADAQTPHQAVMTAMDVASQLGVSRVLFAATSPAASSSQPAASP